MHDEGPPSEHASPGKPGNANAADGITLEYPVHSIV
jgi:hypothetical protein